MSKERLVALIYEGLKEWSHSTNLVLEKHLADSILSDGWIKPPCKVGDIVYAIHHNEILIAKVYGIEIKNHQTHSCVYLKLSLIDRTGLIFSKKLLFGETVFLTREEAEAKLKGEQV